MKKNRLMHKESSENYYKIVQTYENGKKLLSPVPRLWEQDGKLLWPPDECKQKAMCKPWQPPGSIQDGWTEHRCVLKRSYIPTYGQALAEIRTMSDASDTTDIDQFYVPTPRKRTAGARKVIYVNRNPDSERCNFNNFQDQQNLSTDGIYADFSESTTPTADPQPLSHSSLNEPLPPGSQTAGQMFCIGDDGQVLLVQNKTNESQPSTNGVEGMLVSLVDVVSKIQSKQDYIVELLEEIKQKSQTHPSTNITLGPDPDQETFTPIESIEELVDFEAKLRNKDFFNDLYRRLFSVCCPKSGQSGDNVSYRIVDSVFSRKLFVLVSWSGVSRHKQNENFSRFTNSFKFFHCLVKRCDPDYSEICLKNFFQKVINNSKRRLESLETNKPKRLSGVKHFGNIKRAKTTTVAGYSGAGPCEIDLELGEYYSGIDAAMNENEENVTNTNL